MHMCLSGVEITLARAFVSGSSIPPRSTGPGPSQGPSTPGPPGLPGPGPSWSFRTRPKPKCRIDPATPLEPHELVQLVCTVWHGVALGMALQSSQGKGQGLSLGQGLGLGLGQGLCPAKGRRTENRGQRTSVRSGRRTSRQACEQARYCLRELGHAFVPCTCRNYIRPRVCLSASRGVCVPRARAICNPLPCRSCSSPSTTSAAAA